MQHTEVALSHESTILAHVSDLGLPKREVVHILRYSGIWSYDADITAQSYFDVQYSHKI
jgi:hypothetical protein